MSQPLTGLSDQVRSARDLYARRPFPRAPRACERCRIKKSRCSGTQPCTKCVEHDGVCLFSDRKHSQNRSVPRGYTELLERQVEIMRLGLQKMYCTMQEAGLWPGPELHAVDGKYSVHDLLAALGIENHHLSACSPGSELEYQDRSRWLSRESSGHSVVSLASDTSTDSFESLSREPSRYSVSSNETRPSNHNDTDVIADGMALDFRNISALSDPATVQSLMNLADLTPMPRESTTGVPDTWLLEACKDAMAVDFCDPIALQQSSAAITEGQELAFANIDLTLLASSMGTIDMAEAAVAMNKLGMDAGVESFTEVESWLVTNGDVC